MAFKVNVNFTDLLSYRNNLSVAERKIAELVGEQTSLIRRRETLTNEVGVAKGRLANKAKVSDFLEQLQSETNARLVSNYEMLLTALVTEVLQNEAPIGLDLQIERGQPSLDIVSRRSVDRSEDIYEDQGGALTNLVSLGLRMIGVVRSGMSRFLLLDESDCWVATDRVPSFYGVVKDAARKIGVQCLAVSHHDVTTFDTDISIAKLSGHPEHPEGVRVENNPRPHVWTNEEQGIRWIRLKNFQGYIDETLHLTPGVNALVGANNIGKSSFVRAFRAVFYGEARDSLIRWGERICTVEIGFAGGRILSWDRQVKRNPINRWRYLNADGSLVSEDFNTGGRAVPEWVMTEFKIGPLEGMDIHAIKQKEPVFLLNQPASKRAAVLSVGQEASHIRKMLTLHKEQCTLDSARVKEGEAEMGKLLDRLEKMDKLPECVRLIEKAKSMLDAFQATSDATSKMEIVCDNLKKADANKALVSGKLDALSKLPDVDDVKSMELQASTHSKIVEIADKIRASIKNVSQKTEIIEALSNLPANGPSLINSERLVNIAQNIEDNTRHIFHKKKVVNALTMLPDVEPEIHDTQRLHVTLSTIIDVEKTIKKNTETLSILQNLPRSAPEIIRNDDAIKCGKSIRDTRVYMGKIKERDAVLASLPAIMPDLVDNKSPNELIVSIKDAALRVHKTKQNLAQTEIEMTNVENELNTVVASMGNTCPLCQGTIKSATSLLRHSHTEDCTHD
jgi:hypothetical protein